MEKTKYKCPYIKKADKLCSMSQPCCNCVQFSPDYLEKILTDSQRLKAEIAAFAEVVKLNLGLDNVQGFVIYNKLRQLSAV
jgi:hypothetical protein